MSFTEDGKLLFSNPCNPPFKDLIASSSNCLGVFHGPTGGGPESVVEVDLVQIPPAAVHSSSDVYSGPSEQVPPVELPSVEVWLLRDMYISSPDFTLSSSK